MRFTSLPVRPARLPARLHPLRQLGEAWRRLRFRQLVRRLSEQIRIDLREDAQGYTVLAALPGAHKGDIEVAVAGNLVRISAGARAEHAHHATASVLRRERYVGHRQRLLRLPQEIDAARAGAEYRHGVLRLSLPKLGGTAVPVR